MLDTKVRIYKWRLKQLSDFYVHTIKNGDVIVQTLILCSFVPHTIMHNVRNLMTDIPISLHYKQILCNKIYIRVINVQHKFEYTEHSPYERHFAHIS